MAAIFLDLDGTLTDPKPGITAAVQFALRAVGLPVPHADALTWVIGPPLLDSFRDLGAPDPHEALHHYRVHYDDGHALFDAVVHPGVFEGIAMLKEAGHRLYVATAKPHPVARKVTAHFGLSQHFEAEFGPEMDGTRNDKADLLAHALDVTGEKAGSSVMVGDRSHDIRAAHANDMPAIAVEWGFGTPEEHAPANAILGNSIEFGPGILRFLEETAQNR